MEKPKAIILIGIQGAGKSQYTKTLSNYNSVSKDSDGNKYNKKLLGLQIKNSNIVIDNTNSTLKARKELMQTLKSTHDLIAIYFYLSLDQALENIKQRKNKLIKKYKESLSSELAKIKADKETLKVLENAKQYFSLLEAPSSNEGFKSIYVYEPTRETLALAYGPDII